MGVGGKEYFTFCFCISALSFRLEHSNVSHTSFLKNENENLIEILEGALVICPMTEHQQMCEKPIQTPSGKEFHFYLIQ